VLIVAVLGRAIWCGHHVTVSRGAVAVPLRMDGERSSHQVRSRSCGALLLLLVAPTRMWLFGVKLENANIVVSTAMGFLPMTQIQSEAEQLDRDGAVAPSERSSRRFQILS